MKTRAILTFAVLALIVSATADAQAVRTWVSTTGSDANNCARTTPCRNFLAAINAVSPGGEVVVLDSGGYGAVTVNKSVSIISPPGLHAAVAPTAGTAITVNAGNDVIVLRGIYLNSQGATTGISFVAGHALHLENLVVNGFSGGVVFNDNADLFVNDSVIRNNAGNGITVSGTVDGPAYGSLDRVRMERNSTGLSAGANSRVTVRDSVASRNQLGFQAAGTSGSMTAELNIDSSMASNNDTGVSVAIDGSVLVFNSVLSNNGVGVHNTDGDGFARVAGSTISGNTTGLSGGQIVSFGNNSLAGNGTDGTFSATVPLE